MGAYFQRHIFEEAHNHRKGTKMNKHLSWAVKLSAVAVAVLTSGCAEYYIDKLEHTNGDGFRFARELKTEYEAYAKVESRENYDALDASAFAIKGIQAAQGLEVLPEDPRMWDIPAEKMPMLMDARERLLFALHKSGRVIAPALAAKTQVAYDCWVNETEEGNQPAEINRCQMAFHHNVAELEKAVDMQSPMFSVMFDYNSGALRKDAMPTLERVAKIAKNMSDHVITLTGRTDAGGGRKFNLKLSQKRATMVRDALMKMGIPQHRIQFVGIGEHGSKQIEPKNRRVDIEIR